MRERLHGGHRPKNIKIHLTVSHVRFYPLRFNSSGNFCVVRTTLEELPYPTSQKCSTYPSKHASGVEVLVCARRIKNLRRKIVLRLPDLDHSKNSVLSSLSHQLGAEL
jgi:hypothetical protein